MGEKECSLKKKKKKKEWKSAIKRVLVLSLSGTEGLGEVCVELVNPSDPQPLLHSSIMLCQVAEGTLISAHIIRV